MRLLYEPTSDIPINLTEVEYLESTGTQYIDTGLKGNLNTKIEVRVYANMTNNYAVAGDFTTSTKAITMPLNVSLAGLYSRFGDKAITSGLNQPTGTYTIAIDKAGYYVDGVKIASFNTTTSFTTDNNLMLFGFTGLGRNYLVGKVYCCKIWDNGKLVRDLIPCLDPFGRPCMYDKVEGKAYYNQGTGEFTYGKQIIPVEYLQSSGTQYIDTGYYPTNTTKYILKAQFMNPSTTANYMGIIGVSVAPNDRFGMGFYNGKIRQQFGSGAATYGGNYNDSDYTGFNNTTIYECSRNGFYINGTLNWLPTKDFTGTSSVTAFLFYTHAEAEYSGTPQKIYSCKIYDGNNLVRDYIPAIDENGVGFMFDRVTHTIYDNAGTGAFVAGKKLPKKKLRIIKESKRRVPKGFIEVEYLQSTGTQYIDTGYNPGANAGKFTFDIEVQCTVNTAGHGAIGSRSIDNGRSWVITNILQTPTNRTVSQYGYGNTYQNLFLDTSNKWARMRTYIDGSNYVLEVSTEDDTTIYTLPLQTFTNNANVYLFGINNKGSLFTAFPFIGRLRKAKMYNNGTLVRDFIPCKDENNVGYMFDTVTHTAYYNAGTGDFIIGNEVKDKIRLLADQIPNIYKRVNYLEGTGTQYIDTGYTLNNNSEIEIICNSGNIRGTNLFGYRDASANSRNISITTSINVAYTSDFNNSNYATYRASMDGSGNKIVKIILSKNERGFYNIDGSLINKVTTICPDVFTCGSPAYLMNVAGSPYFTECFKGKLYRCTIKESSVFVRDFIPVVRKADNKLGMYDLISKQFFGNMGTGSFNFG